MMLTNFGVPLPKIEALPGSLQPELKRCGKARCHCAHDGRPHGPYWYRHWREGGGRQRKQYIAADQFENVLTAIAYWRRLHPTIWSVRQQLVELHRNSRALEV